MKTKTDITKKFIEIICEGNKRHDNCIYIFETICPRVCDYAKRFYADDKEISLIYDDEVRR